MATEGGDDCGRYPDHILMSNHDLTRFVHVRVTVTRFFDSRLLLSLDLDPVPRASGPQGRASSHHYNVGAWVPARGLQRMALRMTVWLVWRRASRIWEGEPS